MRLNHKIIALTALLAVGMAMTACGGSTSGSTSGSIASSAASSTPASSAVSSSAAEQTGAVQPIEQGTLEDMKTGNYKFAANITAIKDGQVEMTVYSYDAYLKEDIDKLAVGDVISTHLDGADEAQDVTIDSIEKDEDNGSVVINGGIEEGGVELWIDHDVYRTVTMDDYPVYYKVGELTLPLAENATAEDSSADPQASAVESDGAAAVEEAFNADPDYWVCNNTTVFTDNGSVSNIVRVWVP